MILFKAVAGKEGIWSVFVHFLGIRRGCPSNVFRYSPYFQIFQGYFEYSKNIVANGDIFRYSDTSPQASGEGDRGPLNKHFDYWKDPLGQLSKSPLKYIQRWSKCEMCFSLLFLQKDLDPNVSHSQLHKASVWFKSITTTQQT